MKVKQLIAQLQNMPQNAEVLHLWDGEPRTAIEFVWLTEHGRVVTSDYGQICNNMDRPPMAPKNGPWYTPQPDI